MTNGYDSPALRRRLRVELRRARSRAKLTQRDVAEKLDWSPSKVIRIESGQNAISTVDLKALLDQYGINDAAVVDELVGLAKKSRKQPWSQYKDVLSPEVQAYFGYEAAATVIRQFEPLLIPGLLQTADYTRVLFEQAFDIRQRTADRLLEVRHERQEILNRDDGSEAFFVVDEAVIRRSVGGPEMMRAQLDKLLSVAALPHISLQIVPFGLGAYHGLQGPFTLLEFADEADDESGGDEFEAENYVLYLESRSSHVIRDDPDLLAQHLERFIDLERLALDADGSRAMLEEALTKL